MKMEIGITSINEGYLATGAHEIDGKQVYFLKNGIQLRDSLREDENGNQYYYDKTGAQFSTVTILLTAKTGVTLMPRVSWLEVW